VGWTDPAVLRGRRAASLGAVIGVPAWIITWVIIGLQISRGFGGRAPMLAGSRRRMSFS
jgi:hypothetical protein